MISLLSLLLFLAIVVIILLQIKITRLKLRIKIVERFRRAMSNELNEDKKILTKQKKELEELNLLLKKNIANQTLLTQNIIHELKNKFGEIFIQLKYLNEKKISYLEAVKQTNYIKKDFEELLLWTKQFNIDRRKTASFFKFNKIISDIQKIYPLFAFDMVIRNHNKRLFIYHDEKILFIIFHNFIKNSINVIREKIEIDIFAEEDKEFYTFKLLDNGPGFPDFILKSDNEYLHSKTHLGMYLARNLIENSGGILHLANRTNGQGAEIIFKIKKFKKNSYEI